MYKRLLIAALLAGGCGSAATEEPLGTSTAATTAAATLPIFAVPHESSRIRPDSAPLLAPNLLQYYGGHVIPQVKVVVVDWNSSVNATISANMTPFFSALTQSEQWRGLTEYNTGRTIQAGPNAGKPGTQEIIGKGSALKASKNLGQINLNVTDAQLQAALSADFANGNNLPQPDSNTIYMVNFPPGTVMTAGTATSCGGSGGSARQWFIGYHSSFTYKGQPVRYAFLDDTTKDCGITFASALDNATLLGAHELIEAVTDPDPSNPAWLTSDLKSEVADLCNALPGLLDAHKSDGTPWGTHRTYDNASGNCAVDPTLTLLPSTMRVQPGNPIVPYHGPISVPVGSAGSSGSVDSIGPPTSEAAAVVYSVAGVPSGVNVSFSSPQSAIAGGTDVMVTAAPGTPLQSFTLQVTGKAFGATLHTVPVDVQLVSCTPTANVCDGRCGAVDNGCGATVACGGCASGLTCSTQHECVPATCKVHSCPKGTVFDPDSCSCESIQ